MNGNDCHCSASQSTMHTCGHCEDWSPHHVCEHHCWKEMDCTIEQSTKNDLNEWVLNEEQASLWNLNMQWLWALQALKVPKQIGMLFESDVVPWMVSTFEEDGNEFTDEPIMAKLVFGQLVMMMTARMIATMTITTTHKELEMRTTRINGWLSEEQWQDALKVAKSDRLEHCVTLDWKWHIAWLARCLCIALRYWQCIKSLEVRMKCWCCKKVERKCERKSNKVIFKTEGAMNMNEVEFGHQQVMAKSLWFRVNVFAQGNDVIVKCDDLQWWWQKGWEPTPNIERVNWRHQRLAVHGASTHEWQTSKDLTQSSCGAHNFKWQMLMTHTNKLFSWLKQPAADVLTSN